MQAVDREVCDEDAQGERECERRCRGGFVAKLAITTRTLKSATVGKTYRAKIAKVGGVAPIAWTITGKLPKGLKFASKLGVFLGKPTQSGTFRVTVGAVDALDVEAQKRLIIVVKR